MRILNLEKKHYVYLVKNKNHTNFKIGYTYSKDPFKRIKSYYSHNPEIQFIDMWEVDNKYYEKEIQYELKCIFPKCLVRHQREWFIGNVFSFEIKNMIDKIKKRF